MVDWFGGDSFGTPPQTGRPIESRRDVMIIIIVLWTGIPNHSAESDHELRVCLSTTVVFV